VTSEPFARTAGTSEPLINLARSLASLHAARDLNELAGHFEHLGERCIDAALSVLLLADESGDFRPVAGSLRRPAAVESLRRELGIERITQFEDVSSAWQYVVTTRTPQWFDLEDLFAVSQESVAGRRCVMAPIWVAGEALGAVLLAVPETDVSATFVSILAEHVGVAVQRLRELDRARRLRALDPDLWIADEASLREALAHELNRARRYGGCVGVTLLGIECEADLVARYGGFYTSQLLRRVGARLTSAVRDTDVLGAIGRGFAVVHPGTNPDGARVAADRLMDDVGSMLSANYPELELSLIARISADSVASPDDGTTANELIESLLAKRREPDTLDRELAA
jgi:GGDEF domain-containing protein